MADTKVTEPVAEGSLIIIRNLNWDYEEATDFVKQTAAQAGHTRFLVVFVEGDGDVTVVATGDLSDPSADLVDALKRYFKHPDE